MLFVIWVHLLLQLLMPLALLLWLALARSRKPDGPPLPGSDRHDRPAGATAVSSLLAGNTPGVAIVMRRALEWIKAHADAAQPASADAA